MINCFTVTFVPMNNPPSRLLVPLFRAPELFSFIEATSNEGRFAGDCANTGIACANMGIPISMLAAIANALLGIFILSPMQ
jgi:hypothetical protein